MTKDGRPSRLRDIRLISGPHFTYEEGCEQAKAFARRLAWWLNGEELSVGSNHTVFVRLSTELAPGVAEPGALSRDADSWQKRDVAVGVDPASSADEADRVAMEAVELSLTALAPQHAGSIARAAETVREAGADCRFLLRRKETTKEVVKCSSTIATWPAASRLFVSLTDKTTGEYREAPPIEVKVYDHAVYLAGKIKRTREGIGLDPRGSYPAQLISSDTGTLGWDLDELTPAERPPMSGLLNLR
ncbi:hypothetical protein JL108_08195 [Aeromicrobium sp. YIM 150415]|uniref:hypothetical protein n=1 Tax=Aeromicrobium sp. YIM 150415 TaxID=2803912 RepID=UPI001964BE77|nr:hypothetical protein [Aeromicrobium sp. YIM 150415]MBM9463428.1 hypothetical protein [Aeromicrobium sp. YIM 150415]